RAGTTVSEALRGGEQGQQRVQAGGGETGTGPVHVPGGTERGAAPASGEAGSVPGVPEHLLGILLAVLAHGTDHAAHAVDRGGGAVVGIRGGQARHIVLDEGAGEELLAGDAVLLVAVLGGGLLAATGPLAAAGAMGGEQEPADAAQTQGVCVTEGTSQELCGGAGVQGSPLRGEADLEDPQEVRDRGHLAQRLRPTGRAHGQACAGQQVRDVLCGGAGAADHGHVVVLDPLAVVEVAQGGADQSRLVQRVRGAQDHEACRCLGLVGGSLDAPGPAGGG